MRFSLQVHYAVRGLFDLAYNGLGDAVQVRVMSERQQVPVRYLEQIFQRLRRAELVSGKRGPGGGYRLARPPASITLLDIVEAVEGPVGGDPEVRAGDEGTARPAPSRAAGPRRRSSSRASSAATAAAAAADTATGRPDFVWPELARRFAAVLADITLADLCRTAARRGVPRLSSSEPDYQI